MEDDSRQEKIYSITGRIKEAIEDYIISGHMDSKLADTELLGSLPDKEDVDVMLAYMTLHIVEKQQQTSLEIRRISNQIKQSVDDSTNVAKSVRYLTIAIGILTLINVIAAIAVCFKK